MIDSLSPHIGISIEKSRLYTNLYQEVFERNKTEKQLTQSEDKYKILIENLPQKNFYKDRNLTYVSCNQAFAKDLSISAHEIAGNNDYHFFPRELANKYRNDDKRIIETGVSQEIEENYRINGIDYVVSTIKVPVKDENGKVQGVLGIFWDITEKKKEEKEKKELEKQLFHAQKMEALGTFVAGIAHEFNNIIGIISGHADLCLTYISPKQEEYKFIETIQKNCERSTIIVKNLLTFSRSSAVERTPLQVGPLIEETCKMMRAIIPSHIEIQTQISSELPMVNGNATEIHQVMVNLCTNAYHAISETEGKIEIKIEHLSALNGGFASANGVVRIQVKDTGCGISKEIQPKIFTPFFTTKEVKKGTGLGLSLVYGIVQSHQGSIEVQSGQGKGTSFQIDLPALANVCVKGDRP
ncbi:ATP-binding protein [Deltaproteobacteria bacterium TL4]